MSEHRWQIPCSMDPDEAELELADPVEQLFEDGEVIKHVETVGFFGWTVRTGDERAVGISVPQPGGPDQLVVRSEHRKLGEQVAQQLTEAGPLAGRRAHHVERG